MMARLGATFDVIVVGLGAFGSAAAYHLARAGARVLGVDLGPNAGHALGSSHGQTRITRLAYREGVEYVPLLRRSLDLFLHLEQESSQRLFVRTGVLELGPDAASGTALASAQAHGLEHKVLCGDAINATFPAWRVPSTWQGLFQPDGGMLLPEACIRAHCAGAAAAGAELRFGTRVLRWEAGAGPGVQVWLSSPGRTGEATRVSGGQLLLAAGPWMADLVPSLARLMVPVRQVVGWFEISDPAVRPHYQPDAFPVFILDSGDASPNSASTMSGAWYGFPECDAQRSPGMKIGLYNHLHQVVHPDSLDRGAPVTQADEQALRAAVAEWLPGANGRLLAHSTCMFTNTPDGHFIVDRLHALGMERVMVCSACSGHGFKLSSGVGELIAQELVHLGSGTLGRDGGKAAALTASHLSMHRLARFLPEA